LYQMTPTPILGCFWVIFEGWSQILSSTNLFLHGFEQSCSAMATQKLEEKGTNLENTPPLGACAADKELTADTRVYLSCTSGYGTFPFLTHVTPSSLVLRYISSVINVGFFLFSMCLALICGGKSLLEGASAPICNNYSRRICLIVCLCILCAASTWGFIV